jgi:protease-4
MTPRLACALLLLLGATACEGRARTTNSKSDGTRDEPHAGPSIAVLDLSDGVPEQASSGLLGLSAKGASLSDLVHEIDVLDRGVETADVRGVLVRLGSSRVGLARATEVGEMLAALGAKMPVWCYADDYANGTLALAARGCKRIWVAPGSSVDAIGLAAQTIYFHKLLVDEIGLDVDFLQVGKFKGAEEPFTRDGPSPEARESLESTMAELRSAWLEGITEGRPRADKSAAEDGPYTPNGARDRGLVDDVGYLDQARSALESATGAVRSEVRLGPGSQGGSDGVTELLRGVAGDTLGAAPVALVEATGAISMEGGNGIVGDSGGIVERRLVRTLARLDHDDDVKAVVLRIDSPGGSALASDLLWHQLMDIRQKKTLVASIGDMAASGGYYLASSGAVVFADATSIVGSIGVVGGKISGERALDRIGVHSETFPGKTGDPDATARAGFESVLTPWDAATRDRVLETMTGIYSLFLSRVAEGRNIPVERVAASAEGRIFGGRDGKARGLVDEIGGLREAIARARSMAGLPADARVEAATEPSGLLRTLTDDEPQGQTRSGDLGALLGRAARAAQSLPGFPPVGPFVQSLLPLTTGEHALCALPFALTVR